jgi:hypothetical protein
VADLFIIGKSRLSRRVLVQFEINVMEPWAADLTAKTPSAPRKPGNREDGFPQNCLELTSVSFVLAPLGVLAVKSAA